jgi:Fe-S-cluster containining protein
LVICITHSDIIRWVAQDRKDILKQVSFVRGAPQGDGFYFEQTITKPKKPCAFLVNNGCGIHSTKPVCCRDAPGSLTEFSVCPVWNKSYINTKRLNKIKRRHEKDFGACVTHFKELLEIIMRAKGWELKVNM